MIEHKSKTPFGSRHYILKDEGVHIWGEIPFRGRFETIVLYRDISPSPERLWLRGPIFAVGCFVATLGFVGYIIETVIVGMNGYSTASLFTLMWAFIGSVVLLMGMRTYEIIRYKNIHGIPILELIPGIRERSSFDEFHGELKKRIGA